MIKLGGENQELTGDAFELSLLINLFSPNISIIFQTLHILGVFKKTNQIM